LNLYLESRVGVIAFFNVSAILGVPEHPKFDGLTSKWAAIQIRS